MVTLKTLMYSLRHQEDSDYVSLKNIHHITLKSHITKIWGWDDDTQDKFFRKSFELGQIQIIHAFNTDVGYLELNSTEEVLSVINILILPEYQSKGLGSKILRDLITESKKTKRLLKLGVFKINLRAKKLYESLGFKVYGETDTHFMLQL